MLTKFSLLKANLSSSSRGEWSLTLNPSLVWGWESPSVSSFLLIETKTSSWGHYYHKLLEDQMTPPLHTHVHTHTQHSAASKVNHLRESELNCKRVSSTPSKYNVVSSSVPVDGSTFLRHRKACPAPKFSTGQFWCLQSLPSG